MKKNIDPHKVSNFKNTEMSYQKHSTFCMKTKPNNLYFNGEVKRLNQQRIDNFCTEELKQKDPALYYCRLGKKLPKKYQEKPKVQISPVNAFVPPQSKLSKEELNIQTDLIYLDSFEYRVVLGDATFEHEIDHVFIGFYDHPECQHNPDEIILTKWIEWSELIDDIKSRPKQFTPWLFDVLKMVHPHLIKLIS